MAAIGCAKFWGMPIKFGYSAGLLFGLRVFDLGNSRMKSVSPGQFRRKPIELRSEEAGSGVEREALAVLSSGLEAAARESACISPEGA